MPITQQQLLDELKSHGQKPYQKEHVEQYAQSRLAPVHMEHHSQP